MRCSAGLEGARRPAAVVAALLALAAAGCFTGPINRPPEIVVSGPVTPLRRQSAPYHAVATDPDGDQPAVMWDVVQGPCTEDTGRASWPTDWVKSDDSDPETLMLAGDQTNAPFCIWALAIDSHNARKAGHLAVIPVDQAPTAKIQVVAPAPAMMITTSAAITYPLYSTIELSSQGTSDPEGDVLDPTPGWVFDHVPGGSTAVLQGCNGQDQCFVADKEGEYDVSYTVADPSKASGTTSLKIFVNSDQPPCIQQSMPDVILSPMVERDPSMQWTFLINQVVDDGDPYRPPNPSPTMGATLFRWYISRNGEPFHFYNNNFPSFIVAAKSYLIGDSVKLRVEALDRNPATAASLLGCGDENDFCEMVRGSGCFQRITWSIDFR